MNYWSPTQSSVYQLQEIHHASSLRSKQWYLIDCVIVRRKYRQDVRVTKAMCGADCWTDYRLVVSKLILRIQPVRQPQGKKVFHIMFSAMLTDAFQDGDNGIPIRYRFDGKRQPKKVASQIQGADRGARWVPLCWWHGKGCSNRRENASIWFMWQLWSHNQHQNDWGSISASIWKALQGAYHHSERSTTASGRQVHLPWKHIV